MGVFNHVSLLFVTWTLSAVAHPHKNVGSSRWTYPCTTLSNLPFCNPSLSFEERANDLVGRFSVTDLADLSIDSAGRVANLNIAPYEWWNEALHGVAYCRGVSFNGAVTSATMFPQVIGTGAALNRQLWKNIGDMISHEARAMFNGAQAGLTFWTPNVNIFRDPRWGRGQETPGEDPFVNAEYAVNFVLGFQGNDEKYLRASPSCKHFAAYSLDNYKGTTRHTFNAVVDQQDLNDTYLIPFKYCVIKGRVSSLMCSLNALNGVPACADGYLMNTLARDSWGFDGYITSDCGAVAEVQTTHKYTHDNDTTMKTVYAAGLDSDCGYFTREHAAQAIKDGVLPLSSIQRAIKNLVKIHMRLGLYDPVNATSWSKLGPSDVNTKRAQSLALQASRESMVLLKNSNNALPLDKSKIKQIAIVGVHGNATFVWQGSYHGKAPFLTAIYPSIQKEFPNTAFSQGCSTVGATDTSNISKAIATMKNADVIIVSIGIDQTQEKENHDRVDINLPGTCQDALIQAVYKYAPSNSKVILIVTSGGSLDISEPKMNSKVDGILWTGYAGMFAGQAVSDVLFGKYNPSGKLTQTFYAQKFVDEMNFLDMGMRPDGKMNQGRTYRFYTGQNVVYPFGSGLSYTKFSCVLGNPTKTEVMVRVKNEGSRSGDVSVLLFYVDKNGGKNGVALEELVGFDKAIGVGVGEVVVMNMQFYEEFVDRGGVQEGSSFELVGCSV